MAITYKRCEEAWARRRGKTWKAVQRDCRLTMDGDNFVVAYHGWYANEGIPLLSITPDDIVTILSSGEIEEYKQQSTIPNRFTELLGIPVYRSARDFKNREYITRIGTWKKSEPFFAGLQIDMKTNNLLNPKQDMSIVVDKAVVAEAVRRVKTLRKLTKGMARMGAFNDLVVHRLSWQTPPQPKFDSINMDEPTAEDARAVVIVGLHSVETPNLSYWKDGTWTQRSPQEQAQVLLDSAVNKGLELLRKNMYDTTEGSYVKVPAKQRND